MHIYKSPAEAGKLARFVADVTLWMFMNVLCGIVLCSGHFGECDLQLFGAAIPITTIVSSANHFM